MSNFYRDRVCLNVLASDIENAEACYHAAKGYVLIGVLSKNYSSVKEAVQDLVRYGDILDNAVSVGLGAGDPHQWKVVADIVRSFKPKHVNQVFTGVGYTRSALDNETTMLNGLVSPSGTPGLVHVSTGPLSAQATPAIIPIETAITMLQDMGAQSVKFFPMNGLETIEEYKAVARACAEASFALEPTGGIDLTNVEELIRIALDAGVKKVIPHVYSSIIDSQTNQTNVAHVETLYEKMKQVVDTFYERTV
ncbi:2-dehydro-3-deoxy-phosphogluconate aldolase [Shouchella lehensis]|uniref:Oxo-acid lyase n=1 Tax=Shouchella lehensis TaxID=300825 RepID=A0A4Y7WJQ8_9BACI|nr:KDGP aldolase family protein [Shouchella lehensis]MBG9785997.1 2-dehydro-3-deoxyphosphooctonate aldolase [Shouchella lehensis]TES48476.1 oxo-acid lyase [Shouchella lehensis]